MTPPLIIAIRMVQAIRLNKDGCGGSSFIPNTHFAPSPAEPKAKKSDVHVSRETWELKIIFLSIFPKTAIDHANGNRQKR